MWRFNSLTRVPERALSDEEEASEAAEAGPTHFDTTDFSKFLEVSKDKLSIRYTGPGDHETDVGSIQANRNVPKQQRVFYYEATIVDAGLKGLIVVGFAEKGFNLGKHPGVEMNSYGFDGETGKKLAGSSGPSRFSSQAYGPTYSTGDVVGAGILLETQEMFFTKNGQDLGIAFKDVLKVPLYPAVGLHSRNEHVEVNFGAKPFEFDLNAMVHKQRLQQESAVQSMEPHEGVSHQVVQDYLLHHGYAETLRAFEQSAGLAPLGSSAQPMQDESNGAATPPQADSAYSKLCQVLQDVTRKSPVGQKAAAPNDTCRVQGQQRWAAQDSLEVRHRVRQRVMAGDVQGAVQLARAAKLALFSEELPERIVQLEVDFFCKCMAFVEALRAGKVEAAVSLARTDLAPLRGRFLGRSEEFDAMLHDVVALLAYTEPEKSALGPLFLEGQREAFADMLNQTILYAEMVTEQGSPAAPQAALEKLLMQLVSVRDELHTASGGHGPRFRLSEHLRWAASSAHGGLENGVQNPAKSDANGVTSMNVQESPCEPNGQ